MTDNFKPPIKSRTTSELLKIAGSPKKWNPDALTLAKIELSNRGVETKEINKAIRSENNRERTVMRKTTNESYNILDFIFDSILESDSI
jgi:hypothetical protein